jgi:hypothetical protein
MEEEGETIDSYSVTSGGTGNDMLVGSEEKICKIVWGGLSRASAGV